MKWISIHLSMLFFILLAMPAPVRAGEAIYTDLFDEVHTIKDSIALRLALECSLEELGADDPVLEKRRVPAHTAFADTSRFSGRQAKVAAYYWLKHSTLPPRNGYLTMVYKMRTGGYLAMMDLAGDNLKFALTRGGEKARVWITYTSRGALVNYYCAGRRFTRGDDFQACLDRVFITPLVSTVCKLSR